MGSSLSIRLSKSKNKIYVINNLFDIEPKKHVPRSNTPNNDDPDTSTYAETKSNTKTVLNISENKITGSLRSPKIFNKLNSFDLTTILYMNISHNSITEISYVPPNLIDLDCSFNLITNLTLTHLTIEKINCSNNSIVEIDLALCVKLYDLDCSNNNIQSLDLLPVCVQHIDCSKNLIKYLDYLPRNLKTLYCQKNLIESMDNLPCPLKTLDFSNNLMYALPILPVSIREIYFSYNHLTIIFNNQKLHNLHTIYCDNNEITHIDFSQFPNLTTIDCSCNKLKMLEKLPLSVKKLKYAGNEIKTITNVRGNIIPVIFSSKQDPIVN